jgi:hypothetical protein
MTKPSPEELLKTVVTADDLRRRARGQTSTRAAVALNKEGPSFERIYIEPFFNVLGHIWAFFMMAMPAPVRRPFTQWINGKMGGYTPPAAPGLPQRIEETVRLAKELKQKTGQWPALLVLTSHPDTEGPDQWLRFELLRQGLQIADAVAEARNAGAWYPIHPRCLLAIDPYALDTVSSPVAGFYSAWMHRIYIAWDRQPSTQSWFQKHFLLRGTDYSRIAWRLLNFLKNDTPVLMVLSGGLPYNARLLYAAREFVHHLPIKRWKLHKRQAHIDLMNILMKPEGPVWPAEQGELPPETLRTVSKAMETWGLAPDQLGQALAELKEEFKLSVPYRTRLFRVLIDRLVARGKPLLLVAITHNDAAQVRIAPPVGVSSVPSDIASFARHFVTTNF